MTDRVYCPDCGASPLANHQPECRLTLRCPTCGLSNDDGRSVDCPNLWHLTWENRIPGGDMTDRSDEHLLSITPSRALPDDFPAGLCGAQFFFAICMQPRGHKGPHSTGDHGEATMVWRFGGDG